MRRSFSLVDHKVAEAAFFLGKIPDCGNDVFGVRCYVSAFVSSTRSITFALQTVLNGLDGFKDWYQIRRRELGADPLARFFHEFRRVNQHIGDNLVNGGTSGPGMPTLYWFTPTDDIPNVPNDDVETACRKYMVTITSLVYDCYLDFGPHIDGYQRYTEDFFRSIGKTIADAEEEIGLPPGWTDVGDSDAEAYRWQAIRDSVLGCEINDIFYEYLGKTTPIPERLPPYVPKGT